MKITKKQTSISMAALVAASTFNAPSTMAAIDPSKYAEDDKNSLLETNDEVNANSIVESIVRWLIFAAVALSIIMVIVGGIRYVASAGNQEKVTAAKSTIMYALIGLAISILAGVLINFVVDRLANGDLGAPNDGAGTGTEGN